MVNFENKEARNWEKKAEKIRIQSKKGTILKIGQFFQDKFDKTLKGENEVLKRTIKNLKSQKDINQTTIARSYIQNIKNKVTPKNNKLEKASIIKTQNKIKKAPVVKKQSNNKVVPQNTQNNKFGKVPIAKSKKTPVLPRGNYMDY